VIGLSIAEAADRLGISQSALKVRVHRGIGAMRKLLEAQS
jgi:DNA-directed RNA polymerase specialized sigma24 family protein